MVNGVKGAASCGHGVIARLQQKNQHLSAYLHQGPPSLSDEIEIFLFVYLNEDLKIISARKTKPPKEDVQHVEIRAKAHFLPWSLNRLLKEAERKQTEHKNIIAAAGK